MAANRVEYASGSIATERGRLGRTQAIWKNFRLAQVREDPSLGDMLFENFLFWQGGAVASKLGNYSGQDTGWHSFEDTSCSIKLSGADNPTGQAGVSTSLGVLKLLTAATAHINVAMELGATANAVGSGLAAFGVGPSAAATVPAQGSLPKLFFETRVRFVQSTVQSAFFGLALPNKTSGANTVFSIADAYANMNCVGFQIDGATSTTKINAIYGITASAPVTVGNGGVPSTADYIGQTLSPVVAGALTDFTKLGFVIDPSDQNGQLIKYYQDGILLGGQTFSQITAAKWPSALPLNPLFYLQAQGAGGAAVELDIDWVAVGQQVSTD